MAVEGYHSCFRIRAVQGGTQIVALGRIYFLFEFQQMLMINDHAHIIMLCTDEGFVPLMPQVHRLPNFKKEEKELTEA